MPSDENSKKYRSLDDWFYTPAGRRVASVFTAELENYNEFLYGKTLLQLGNCGANQWLDALHFNRKWILTPYINCSNATLIASTDTLPFDKNSLDCVIAPFVFEILRNDKQIVVELDRVLKPMGYVVVMGINPWSLWGASAKWASLPYLGHAVTGLRSSFSIKRAMLNLGYRQCTHANFYYIPPVSNEKWITRLEFFNEIGKMLWPFPAGFYCLILQKRELCPNEAGLSDEKEFLLEQKSSMPISG